MSCDNCKSGFAWNGKTVGTESKLGKNNVYVTGTNKDAAVLIITDVFGWTLTNVRILADHYAKEANVTVYVPDFFDGEIVDPESLSDPVKRNEFDLMAFLGRNSKEKRWPEMLASAQELKKQYPKVGALGFCYGAWACFKFAADPSVIDAISTAHPSMLEHSEIDNVKVPVQILAPENDFAFTEELKRYTLEKLPKTGVPFEYIHFPGLEHGFAARGDPKDKLQKEGLEKAKNNVVNFFTEYLH